MRKKKQKDRVVVVGAGYVGSSLAAVMSHHREVWVVDLQEERVEKMLNGQGSVADPDISSYLTSPASQLFGTTKIEEAAENSEFIVIATPTNYDEKRHYFDTSSVSAVAVQATQLDPEATIVIKSTIPIGFTAELYKQLRKINPKAKLLFSPEFLREGLAVHDTAYPSRVVVGVPEESEELLERAQVFADLLIACAAKENVKSIIIASQEAEAVKLFANTYLAMRVAYFNELDTFATMKGMKAENIIAGISLDPRIGEYYNNPSFGYGGYCLPKDSKQLLANYEGVPNNLISAIVASNVTRKDFITNQVLEQKPRIVGIYRLIAKEGSDNFRSAAIKGIVRRLSEAGVEMVLYEPEYKLGVYQGLRVMEDLKEFKKVTDLIIANRASLDLFDVKEKVYTRDIFHVE